MNKYLPLLIFFILVDVVCDNSILRIFASQPSFRALTLSMGMLVLQMVAAPIQAGFSDFYCRKKSLVLSLVFSLVSLCILFFVKTQESYSILFLVFALVAKGAFGNTVPLSWAALADTQEKNLRFSLALSTGAYAIGYMVLAILNMHEIKNISEQTWLSADTASIILSILAVVLCLFFLRDVRDKKTTHVANANRFNYLKLIHLEFIALLHDVCHHSTRLGLLAYFLWATSLYSILILFADFQTKYTATVIWMMSGYLTGVVVLGVCKNIRDEKMIRAAFIITIAAFLVFFVVNPFFNVANGVLSVCCYFYAIGNAFLSPTIFSLFSKERKPHQQGKGFGFIVAADSAGFLVASIVVMVFNYFNLNLFFIILFSFLVFVPSWFPYLFYEKARKTLQRPEA